MTVVAVLADPPREGLVLPRLSETSPLSPAEATTLYEAMLKDALQAVARSGGDLLVNYRDDETLPEAFRDDTGDAEAAVRAVAREALTDADEVRFERQVGSTHAARVGNTVSHLLREEGVASAAALPPNAPLVSRLVIDNAAMKLRRSPVVLGPADGGRTYYAGFTAPVDFEGAYEPPELETLTDRGLDAGHDVDFLPVHHVVETGGDLASVVSLLRARLQAERVVPTFTTELVHEWGLRTVVEDGTPAVVRE